MEQEGGFAHHKDRYQADFNERSGKMRSLVFICACLMFVIPCQARTIMVDDDGPADFDNIKAAIDDANDGDEIVVADGRYDRHRYGQIDFKGKAVTVRSENGPENCIIDCDLLGDRGLCFQSGEKADSVLDGFTITSGYAKVGGGIYCHTSGPTIANCIITANRAKYGGAIYCYLSNPTLANCIITDNRADYGGAICCVEASSPTVSNCNVSYNFAGDGAAIYCVDNSSPTVGDCIITGNSAGGGGAIYCRQSSPVITSCAITENSAKDGGAVYCAESGIGQNNPTITNCKVADNTAEDRGGAIYCVGPGSARIQRCAISRNWAQHGQGGGMYFRGGKGGVSNPIIADCTVNDNAGSEDGGALAFSRRTEPTISNCKISGNSTNAFGGAISFYDSYATIKNCALAGNAADDGSALTCCDSNLTITNCTITDNVPDEAVAVYCNDECTVAVTNCVVWADTAADAPQIYLGDNSDVRLSYTALRHGRDGVYLGDNCTLDWGPGNIDTDPCFAFPNNHRLTSFSACIDAGDPNYTPEPNETDLDGAPRVSGPAIDMAAYEFNTERPLIAVYPCSIRFSYLAGGPEPNAQTLFVRNCGGAPLFWQIGYDCNWLEAVPEKGRSTGEIDHVALTVNPDSMPAGYYRCTLMVVDRNAAASPATVQVTVTVGPVLPVPDDFATIQDAIDAADDGDIVVIADGVYTGEGNRDIDFLGKAITVRSESGPENCIIDCRSTSRYGYGKYWGFMFNKQESGESVLDGLTITNAAGAIYCGDYSDPIIRNCNITGNTCYSVKGGGGITCRDSSPTIINCRITDNLAESPPGGGGICCIDSSPKITNCVISGNVAENYRAGGIYCSNQANRTTGPIITNCAITDNYAYEVGAMYAESSSPIISDCTISNNESEHYRAGGIMCAYESSPTIVNCRLTGNKGGAIEYEESRAIITNCNISGNSSGYVGSAIRCSDSNSIISNCRVTGNWVRSEGAVNCRYQSRLIIDNCTIAENRAGRHYELQDSGVYCSDDSTLIVNNSILWGGTFENSSPDPNNIAVTYSDIQGGWEGEGNIDAEPCFVEAGYWDVNGVWGEGDYHLLAGSPCIDAGDPNYIAEVNEKDLDGNPRVIGGRIDMGAYEYSPPIAAEVEVVPGTLNVKSEGKWIVCKIRLGEDYDVGEIEGDSVLLEYEVEAESVRIDEGLGVAVARFGRQDVQEILEAGEEVEVVVSGELVDGARFEGADMIRVIDRGSGKSGR